MRTEDHQTLKKLVSFPCPAISFFLLGPLPTVLPGILTEALVGFFFCGGSFSDPPCWSDSTCFLLLFLLCIWMPLLSRLPRPAPRLRAFPLLCPSVAPRCTPLCSSLGLSEVDLAATKQKQVWQAVSKKKKENAVTKLLTWAAGWSGLCVYSRELKLNICHVT